jgi:opacity protein-like surface antigen
MKKISALAASLALASGVVYAASDGAPGATSTGTTDVSIRFADRVVVQNLNDIVLDESGRAANDPITAFENFCIGKNIPGDVTVTVSSANPGAGNEFQVADALGVAADAVYAATLYSATNGSGGGASDSRTLTSGSVEAAFSPDGASPITCAIGDNVSLQIDIAGGVADSMQGAADTWEDTITILVAP